jgi:hypothetical protein
MGGKEVKKVLRRCSGILLCIALIMQTLVVGASGLENAVVAEASETTGETIKEIAGETVEESIVKTVRKIPGEATEKATGEVTENAPEESAEKAIAESTENVTEESAENTIGESAEKAIEKSTENASGKSAENALGESAENTSGDSAEKAIAELTENAPGESAGKAIAESTENALGESAEKSSVSGSGSVAQSSRNRASARTSVVDTSLYGITLPCTITCFYNVEDYKVNGNCYYELASDGSVAYCNYPTSEDGPYGTYDTALQATAAECYVIAHGYPATNKIAGVTWSDLDARAVTQLACWLVNGVSMSWIVDSLHAENGYSVPPQNMQDAAETLANAAMAYQGGDIAVDGSTFVLADSSSNAYQTVLVSSGKKTGYASIKKGSANTSITGGNRYYDLEGARYGVYSDSACKEKVGEVKTDKNGESGTLELLAGTYYIQEIEAPKGYVLDSTVYKTSIKTGEITQVDVQDVPQKIRITLEKCDKETSKNTPQGAASLAGAIYEVKNEKNQIVDTLTTDKNGKASSAELPLGKYTVCEKQASEGYLLDTKVYTVDGAATDDNTKETYYYAVKSKEQIIRGDVEIVKLRENIDEDEDTLQGLEGIEFTFTSNSTGKVAAVIKTDKNGFATTAAEGQNGSLMYDTYTVTETKAPSGLKKIEPFEVIISEDAVVLKGIYKEDKLIVSPVTVVKVDQSTGNIIPIAGTEFRLLDAKHNPITMTSYYPEKKVYETFETNENGQFTFPEKLAAGTYYLEEVAAPLGYLKGETLEFQVTEGATWENPLVIKYADEIVKGYLELVKTDAETAEVLAGAEYTVRAAEDIVTPDGTLQVTKGEVVETLVTDEEGKAVSKELFLGTYEIEESKAPRGYARDTEVYSATLEYQDQDTSLVKVSIEVEDSPTTVIIKKMDEKDETRLPGVVFSIWKKESIEGAADAEQTDGEHEVAAQTDIAQTDVEQTDIAQTNTEQTNGEQEDAEIQDYVTDENGEIKISYLTPGTYCLQEKESIVGYGYNSEIFEFTVDEDGRIEGKDVKEIAVTDQRTVIVGTTALDMRTQGHQAIAEKEYTFTDKVYYAGAKIGKEYELQAHLVNALTGDPVLDGTTEDEVGASLVFTADAEEGMVEIEFHFDASKLQGIRTVCLEEMYEDNVQIASHTDLEDEEQTIEFPKITMKTSAVNPTTNQHEIDAAAQAVIRDNVTVEGLPETAVGKYELKGTLVEYGTGKEIVQNGDAITSIAVFEKATNQMMVEFSLDASALAGKKVTVYEALYYNGTLIAEHKDPTDEEQTIYIRSEETGEPTPEEATPKTTQKESVAKTSDSNNVFGLVVAVVLSFGTIILLTVKKKKCR